VLGKARVIRYRPGIEFTVEERQHVLSFT
jgi:hypothetical protein